MKYTIWAADSDRAARFYGDTFSAKIVKQNPHITELEIAGGILSIHSGGEGKKTWTGIICLNNFVICTSLFVLLLLSNTTCSIG